MKAISVTGIHTDAGKTIASAVITQALGCTYWKPMQSGSNDKTDTMTVQSLVSNSACRFLPEAYLLREPLSPHAAARIDNVQIDINKLRPIETEMPLLIETAGGLMSPVNDEFTVIDYVQKYHLPTVLVSTAYLGSINHTLLCMELLKQRNIDIKALIFCGERNMESEEFILNYTQFERVLHIKKFESLEKGTIAEEADMVKEKLKEYLGI